MSFTNLHHHGDGKYTLVLREQNTIQYSDKKCTLANDILTCKGDKGDKACPEGSCFYVAQTPGWVTAADRDIAMTVKSDVTVEIHCSHNWNTGALGITDFCTLATCASSRHGQA